jgi:hypothetical protein
MLIQRLATSQGSLARLYSKVARSPSERSRRANRYCSPPPGCPRSRPGDNCRERRRAPGQFRVSPAPPNRNKRTNPDKISGSLLAYSCARNRNASYARVRLPGATKPLGCGAQNGPGPDSDLGLALTEVTFRMACNPGAIRTQPADLTICCA